MYICIELFDEMQSAAVQRSYIVAKSLPTTFPLSTQRCHSDRYKKVSYPGQRYVIFFTITKGRLHFLKIFEKIPTIRYSAHPDSDMIVISGGCGSAFAPAKRRGLGGDGRSESFRSGYCVFTAFLFGKNAYLYRIKSR